MDKETASADFLEGDGWSHDYQLAHALLGAASNRDAKKVLELVAAGAPLQGGSGRRSSRLRESPSACARDDAHQGRVPGPPGRCGVPRRRILVSYGLLLGPSFLARTGKID